MCPYIYINIIIVICGIFKEIVQWIVQLNDKESTEDDMIRTVAEFLSICKY